MACMRPILYPFMGADAKRSADQAYQKCQDERTARVQARQEARTDRTAERMETARDLGRYQYDFLWQFGLPAVADATGAIAGAVAGVPVPPTTDPALVAVGDDGAGAPLPAAVPTGVPAPAMLALAAAALAGVVYYAGR